MTYEEFVAEYHRLLEDDQEKAAVLLCEQETANYHRYVREWLAEEID